MAHKPRILAVHLLNDFSGSPFVFSQSLQALHEEGYAIHLFTATPSGKGFLSGLPVVEHPLFYKWSPNKWVTLGYFLLSQCLLFWKILRASGRGDLVYINTMLPFGAALAARCRGARVLYHLHEVSVAPAILKKFLQGVIRLTANHCIYVSGYVKQETRLPVPGTVIYNALPEAFIQKARGHATARFTPFRVLMLCSLKKYKGVMPFIQCAAGLPEIEFEMVLNASTSEIEQFFQHQSLPPNLRIYPAQSDVHPFYEKASLVMNLSVPDQWVETFGMTALEGMVYGKPVIVPPVGGIVELVENGVSGYCLDARDTPAIMEKIIGLSRDRVQYDRMSQEALARAGQFTQEGFRKAILDCIRQEMPAGNPKEVSLANG